MAGRLQLHAPLNARSPLPARSTYQWPACSVVMSHCWLPGPWGRTGMVVPSRVACACTVNRTVALRLPAGCADTILNEVTVILGPALSRERVHDRWAGGTVCAAAAGSLALSAVQNALTACSAAAPWAGDSVPDTAGGVAAPSAPPAPGAAAGGASVISCAMLATWAAGGAETRTGTPKS